MSNAILLNAENQVCNVENAVAHDAYSSLDGFDWILKEDQLIKPGVYTLTCDIENTPDSYLELNPVFFVDYSENQQIALSAYSQASQGDAVLSPTVSECVDLLIGLGLEHNYQQTKEKILLLLLQCQSAANNTETPIDCFVSYLKSHIHFDQLLSDQNLASLNALRSLYQQSAPSNPVPLSHETFSYPAPTGLVHLFNDIAESGFHGIEWIDGDYENQIALNLLLNAGLDSEHLHLSAYLPPRGDMTTAVFFSVSLPDEVKQRIPEDAYLDHMDITINEISHAMVLIDRFIDYINFKCPGRPKTATHCVLGVLGFVWSTMYQADDLGHYASELVHWYEKSKGELIGACEGRTNLYYK